MVKIRGTFDKMDKRSRETQEHFRLFQQQTPRNLIHNRNGTGQFTTILRCNNNERRKRKNGKHCLKHQHAQSGKNIENVLRPRKT